MIHNLSSYPSSVICDMEYIIYLKLSKRPSTLTCFSTLLGRGVRMNDDKKRSLKDQKSKFPIVVCWHRPPSEALQNGFLHIQRHILGLVDYTISLYPIGLLLLDLESDFLDQNFIRKSYCFNLTLISVTGYVERPTRELLISLCCQNLRRVSPMMS